MNYELAQELKDAGFPKIGFLIVDTLSYPTLSELIEACGNPLMLMWFEGNKEERINWETDHKGKWQAFNDTYSDCSHEASGKTPEEAVAKLWLMLNKK